ncbi:hypothetical protein BDF21DRAFT_395709 [Thamnidium elegans]|nr:hypothetical protein BDF21DRAFT_395709 [Thamnidium elegans]
MLKERKILIIFFSSKFNSKRPNGRGSKKVASYSGNAAKRFYYGTRLVNQGIWIKSLYFRLSDGDWNAIPNESCNEALVKGEVHDEKNEDTEQGSFDLINLPQTRCLNEGRQWQSKLYTCRWNKVLDRTPGQSDSDIMLLASRHILFVGRIWDLVQGLLVQGSRLTAFGFYFATRL